MTGPPVIRSDLSLGRLGSWPPDGRRVHVQIRSLGIFSPRTGEVRSDDTDGIACCHRLQRKVLPS